MAKEKLSEATCARTYASVRRFVRWIHQKVGSFPLGCPTDGIKPPREPEPEWKGLSRADELRLLAAAQTLRLRPGRGTNQGLRDHAAVAVLLGSGLRVTEIVTLNRKQYTGRGLRCSSKVAVSERRSLFITTHARCSGNGSRPVVTPPVLASQHEQATDSRALSSFGSLQRIAAQANAHLPTAQHIAVSPRVLSAHVPPQARRADGRSLREGSFGTPQRPLHLAVREAGIQSLADAVDELA